MTEMSKRGRELQRSIAMTFELLEEHEKQHAAEVEELYAAIVAHVRSARPSVLLDRGAL